MLNVVIVIPARFASTRFPGKPLVRIAGKTMIERVWLQAKQAKLAKEVIVATDDERIANTVKEFGGIVEMTSSSHQTGTDRLAEVALRNPSFDLIVNVQGDEPLICPATIDAAIEPMLSNPELEMSTLSYALTELQEVEKNTIVKVVSDKLGNALYFSRLPIPYYRDLASASSGVVPKHFAHVGLYVYRRSVLLKLAELSPSPLEQAESLEQLRALENGIRIRVVEVKERSQAVDCPDDLLLIENILTKYKENTLITNTLC